MVFRGVKIDKCHECGGVWLDAGELETLAGPEGHSVISEILKLFKPGAPKG
jgi:Zn-finger nucleic acid-binding protein